MDVTNTVDLITTVNSFAVQSQGGVASPFNQANIIKLFSLVTDAPKIGNSVCKEVFLNGKAKYS